jgi:hypothetical protein
MNGRPFSDDYVFVHIQGYNIITGTSVYVGRRVIPMVYVRVQEISVYFFGVFFFSFRYYYYHYDYYSSPTPKIVCNTHSHALKKKEDI